VYLIIPRRRHRHRRSMVRRRPVAVVVARRPARTRSCSLFPTTVWNVRRCLCRWCHLSPRPPTTTVPCVRWPATPWSPKPVLWAAPWNRPSSSCPAALESFWNYTRNILLTVVSIGDMDATLQVVPNVGGRTLGAKGPKHPPSRNLFLQNAPCSAVLICNFGKII